MSSERNNTLWPVGTLEQRMDNKTEFDEHGNLNIGTEEEMLAKHRAWRLEHEAVLRVLGIPMAGEQPPTEGDDDISDLHDYDDL